MDKEKDIQLVEIPTDPAARYYKLFKDAHDFHKARFDEITELVAYYELQQDALTTFASKPWVYQINTPYATDAVNLRVASLQANDYTGELEPLSPEDVDAVKELNDIYHEFWNEMNMDNTINDAILTGSIVGDAYTHVVFDDSETHGGTSRKNKGKLKSYFLDFTSVHLDPKSLTLKEADYVCVSERVTKSKIKTDYPDFDFETLKGQDSVLERGEIFAGTDYTTNQDTNVYNKVTIYEKKNKTIEKTVLLERSILVPTKTLDIRVFPIAQFKWQKRLKSPYGTSLMQMLLPLQKVLNEIESANANANMQYSSPSYVISEDSGIDPEELAINAGAPAAVYVVASGYPIDQVIKPLIPNRGIDTGLVTTKQELERSIYKLAGVNDQFMGDIGTSGNTASGADIAMQRAKTIEQRVLVNIEEFVEDLTHIVVEYITQAYAGDTLYSRGQKKATGGFDFKEFRLPENAAEIEYSFYIELNVKTQYSKDQQKVAIKELFEIERQYDTGEPKVLNLLDILRALNIPQTDELIARYTNLAKMDASQRAELVTEIVMLAQQYEIDPQMLNQAVTEIMLGKQETPTVDMLMQIVEQTKMKQEMARQTVIEALTKNKLEKERVAQEPTGDETFGAEKM